MCRIKSWKWLMAQCTVHTFCPGATLGWARLGSPQLHNRFKGSSCCTGNYNCQSTCILLTFCYFIYHFWVAIALLEQVLLWPCGNLSRLCLHPPTRIQALFKGCCRKLAYGSFQLIHMSHDDHAVHVEWTIAARWKTKTYYSTHNFATGWILAPKCQFTMVITTEFSWAFPESYTTNSSRIRCPSDRKTKAPPPRWVSTLLLDIWVCAWGRPWQCSQDPCRPFLQAWKFHYLHYIMWHYFLCARSVTIHHSMFHSIQGASCLSSDALQLCVMIDSV